MSSRGQRVRSAAPCALAALLLLGTGACATPAGSGVPATPVAAPASPTVASSIVAPSIVAPSTGAPAGPCEPVTSFDRANFPRPTTVDNRWLPLVPGTQFVLEGRSNRGGAPLPHRLTTTVTDLTKVVDGVPTVVLWETDMDQGELAEAELQFDAQDNAGNVWDLGEYPAEYDGGNFTGAPSTWLSGVGGAQGGVLMRGDPELGRSGYRQGLVPEIKFLDCAVVTRTDEKVCLPPKCYDNVVVTDETSPLAPDGGVQRKYNAPGVGTVQVAAVDDPEGETLVLTGVVHLGPAELAKARDEALKLEKHAYQTSLAYRGSSPIGS